MAVESSMPQDLVVNRKSREGSEPKKKLKKTRSIRLSKVPSLKSASRRSRSKFSWLSADLSSDDTSTANGFSESSSNSIKPSSSPESKKHNDQANRIKKMLTSYGSVKLFSRRGKSRDVRSPTVASSESATSQHPSSADGSPNYLKGTSSSAGKKFRPQASPRHTESTQRSSESFKTKGALSEDKNVDKATCSSIPQHSNFPERVELLTGQTEGERASKMKVCPYHHCSLNGHSHEHAPLLKRPYKKRQSLKTEKGMKSISESSSSSNHHTIRQLNPNQKSITEEGGIAIRILTPRQDEKEKGFTIEIHAKSRAQFSIKAGGEVVKIFAGESSYQEESVNQTISSTRKMQDIIETSEVNRTSTEDQYSNKNGNAVLSHAYGPDQSITPSDQARTRYDSDSNSEPSKNETITFTKNSDNVIATLSEQAEDAGKWSLLAAESEPSPPKEGNRAQIKKQRHISMWHLIQQQMVSGLAAESETNPLHRENEESRDEDIGVLQAETRTETTGNSSDSDVGYENHDTMNQDIELRKVFAIKLVREAIEKILLPEVPDQSSDVQSITSDNISELDHSESNFNEETKIEERTERRAPKHWSNIKKWILLQRFIKAVEKVKQFNPKKPQYLEMEPDPDAEKVSLRHQATEERKRAEEWMLDYALRQAVSELAPTQKKKVSMLVKAFETVKPPQGDSSIHLKSPKPSKEAKLFDIHENVSSSYSSDTFVHDEAANERQRETKSNSEKEDNEKRDYIRMWHMVYQHVVSSIADKVGSKLLEQTEDEEADNDEKVSGFSKNDAIKLVQEAVDEIIVPEIQEDSSETKSVTIETFPDQEISEKNQKVSKEDKSGGLKSKNWSTVKKLMLLRRSITALEKARNQETEKVDLRQQMLDERNKAEQWMLDYAVQHIVTSLTPARKKRVAMLVEAFEAVVPLPEM